MKNETLIFQQIPIGPMQNYSYVVGDAKTKQVLLVDPGWDAPGLERLINDNQWLLQGVLLTHGHYDHATACADMQKLFNVPAYLSAVEMPLYVPQDADLTRVEDGQIIKCGEVVIECISTPGHTPGGMCFLVDKTNLITGDTLFLDGCGRWDLPGGDESTLMRSIQNKLGGLSDDILVYPGHNYHELSFDKLGHQKQVNPCFQASRVG